MSARHLFAPSQQAGSTRDALVHASWPPPSTTPYGGVNMKTRQLSLILAAAAGLAACGDSKEHKRADSLATAKAAEQQRLTVQLAAQKDSLTRVVLQADDFIQHIDSSVSRVIG